MALARICDESAGDSSRSECETEHAYEPPCRSSERRSFYEGLYAPRRAVDSWRLASPRSGTGPVAQPVFKTGEVVQPTAG